ncbi:MAG TPA: hypothetical protein VG821_04140 [Rhizomicrobium sp.]|nr:hypothetical protein [Rhizomicrobium sp.]
MEFAYKQFEAEGEDRVRENLALGRYGSKSRIGLATRWLEMKDQSRLSDSERERRSERAEERRIARSAKNAAWIAAIAAMIAAICAIIVMVHPATRADITPVGAKLESAPQP